jgi:kynurenine formamidase
MELIDLTHPISDGMPVYPSDSPVRLFQEKVLEKDHYNNFRLETNLHAGTHIDSPMHLTNSPHSIDTFPLETFIGNACVLDVRGSKEIAYQSDFEEKVKENDIVLLFTGHDREFGKDGYFEKYPAVDKALAEFFISKKIKMLGIDAPSPDYFPFEIHKLLFDQNILIIENLTNLGKLISKKNVGVMALPLKLRADSSLVRVVARVDQDGQD